MSTTWARSTLRSQIDQHRPVVTRHKPGYHRTRANGRTLREAAGRHHGRRLSGQPLAHEHTIKPFIVSSVYHSEAARRVVGHKFIQLGVRVEAERLQSQGRCTPFREAK